AVRAQIQQRFAPVADAIEFVNQPGPTTINFRPDMTIDLNPLAVRTLDASVDLTQDGFIANGTLAIGLAGDTFEPLVTFTGTLAVDAQKIHGVGTVTADAFGFQGVNLFGGNFTI